MKKYTCDICKTEFGSNVNLFGRLLYEPSNFYFDSDFKPRKRDGNRRCKNGGGAWNFIRLAGYSFNHNAFFYNWRYRGTGIGCFWEEENEVAYSLRSIFSFKRIFGLLFWGGDGAVVFWNVWDCVDF